MTAVIIYLGKHISGEIVFHVNRSELTGFSIT